MAEPLTHDLLDELAERMRERGDPLGERLRPSLPADDVDRLLQPLGLHLPREARTWWSWHNGVQEGTSTVVAGSGLRLLPLEVAVADTAFQRDLADDLPGLDWWKSDWLVLMSDLGGSVITISAGPADTGPTSPLHYAAAKSTRTFTPQTQSIAELVQWWIDAIDGDAYVFDTEAGRWTCRCDRLDPKRRGSGLL